MVYFDNVDVIVNSSGIMAESATINSENSLIPIYSVGKRGVHNHAPNGPIKATFQFTYTPEINREPNFSTVNLIKQLSQVPWSGLTLNVGGVIGYDCYLQNYSLKASPNDVIKATASYVTFLPLICDLHIKTNTTSYAIDNSVGHSWTTFVVAPEDTVAFPFYNLDYSFSATWEPTYIIGQQDPVQVNLEQASEQIVLMHENFYNIKFSGEDSCERLINCTIDNKSINIGSLALLSTGRYSGDLYSSGSYLQSYLNFITNVSGISHSTGSSISWTTATNTTTQIIYGTTTGSGLFSSTVKNNTLSTYHSGNLTGLVTDVTYFFRVISEDFPNQFQSPIYFFTVPTGSLTGFAGQLGGGYEQWTDKLNGNNLTCNGMQIDISGAKLKSSVIEAKTDDMVRVSTTIVKDY